MSRGNDDASIGNPNRWVRFCLTIKREFVQGGIPKTAMVALKTCAYISTIGFTALVFPSSIIRACGSMSTVQLAIDPVLIRIGGCLAILFGMYYCGAALDDIQGNKPRYFYTSTVYGRYFLGIVFACIYWNSSGMAWILALAGMNVFSGYQMQRALSLFTDE